MPVKPHPTNPDKMVYVKAEYNLPKPWVGLTDEEQSALVYEYGDTPVALCLETERKLKEKNT